MNKRGGKVIHGMSGHPALESYKGAKGRCGNPNDRDYAFYGGRGIEFRLGTFNQFWQVMGDSWFQGATLERIDNDGHYEIGNVRWATRREQCLNTRKSRLITHNGITQNLALWAEQLNMTSGSLAERISKWGIEKAISTPKKKARTITHNGQTMTIQQWAAHLGVDQSTLRERIDKWGSEKAVTTSNKRTRA